jgi:hypothetical protein
VTVQDERRRLLGRVLQAAEDEHTRIAHDLHDGPVQQLAVPNYDIYRARQAPGRPGRPIGRRRPDRRAPGDRRGPGGGRAGPRPGGAGAAPLDERPAAARARQPRLRRGPR